MIVTLITILFYFTITQADFVNIQPMPAGRRNTYAGSIDNLGLIFITGGIYEPLKSIDIYNATSNSWLSSTIPFPEIDTYSSGFRIIELQNQNSLIIKEDNEKKTIYIYNGNSNSWTKNELSSGRSFIATTSLTKPGLAFFAGGSMGYSQFTNLVEIYNINTNLFNISYLSQARRLLVGVSLNNLGYAFFIGGENMNRKAVNTVDIYDANTNVWSVTNFLSTPRYSSSVASLEKYNTIFIAGGYNQFVDALDDVDIYNAVTKIWTTARMSIARSYFAMHSFDNEGLIFCAGGTSINLKQMDNIDIFDFINNQWKLSKLPKTVESSGIAVLRKHNLLIIAGGLSSISKTNAVIPFSPCLFGTYLTINPTSCAKCPSGYYCPDFNVIPIICPEGNYCPEGSGEPVKCPTGFYGSQTGFKNITQCQKCPIGTFNSVAGQTLQGCMTCTTGSYCDLGSSLQNPCPSQNYCPTPIQKVNCPIGTFFDGIGATNINFCQPCNKGYSCPGSGKSQIACSPGTYTNNEKSISCDICPEGTYCGLGSSEPIPCLINTYSIKGSSACTPCGAGKYTETPGSSRCLDCVGGQFDISGWWCMTLFDKILFVFVWAGSILSGVATLKKLRQTYIDRKALIEKEDLPFNLRNLLLIESIIEEKEKKKESLDKEISLITISNKPVETFCQKINIPKFINKGNQEIKRKIPRLPQRIKNNDISNIVYKKLIQKIPYLPTNKMKLLFLFICIIFNISAEYININIPSIGTNINWVVSADDLDLIIYCSNQYLITYNASNNNWNYTTMTNYNCFGNNNVFYMNGFVYFLGNNNIYGYCIISYDVNKNIFISSNNLPYPINDISSFVGLDSMNLLYFHLYSSTYMYSPLFNNFTEISKYNTIINGIILLSIPKYNKIIIAGGYTSSGFKTSKLLSRKTITGTLNLPVYDTNTYYSTVKIYNAITNSFIETNIPEIPTNLNMISLNNIVFFYGIWLNSKSFNIYTLNVLTLEWNTIEAYKQYSSAVTLPDKKLIYFVTTSTNNLYSELLSSIDIYDYSKNIWINTYYNNNYFSNGVNSIISLPNHSIVFVQGYTYNEQNILIPSILALGDCEIGLMTINPRKCIVSQEGEYCNHCAQNISCSAGYYCPFNTSNPISCPAGTYNNKFGSITINDCLVCPAGQYCPEGSGLGNLCNPGYYCPRGSTQQIACPYGTYGPQINAISASQCINCPAGTFSGNYASSSLQQCSQCSLGSYCPNGSATLLPCPENYYCPTPNQKIACPIGKYYESNFAISESYCKNCEPGTFCAGNGESPIPCESGTYSNINGASSCNICPAGYSCTFGSNNPIICPKNTFAIKGSSGCTPCDEGYFTKNVGSSSCFVCPSSKFDINGWWCMNDYERIVFVFVWIGTIFSGCLSIWKTKEYVSNKINRLNEYGAPISLLNIIFTDRALKYHVKLTVTETDDGPMIDKKQINAINNLIQIMKKDLTVLDSRLNNLENK